MASAVTKLEVPPTYVRPQETPLRETVIGQRQPQTQEAWPLEPMPAKCRRSRTKFTEEQLKILIDAFNQKPYPGYAAKKRLALQVNTEESRIQIWFQNRRARHQFPKRPGERLDARQGRGPPAEQTPGRGDRRSRTSYTNSQLQTLIEEFKVNPYPGIDSREKLAKEIGVPESRVQVWFQNRRSRQNTQKEREPGEAVDQGQNQGQDLRDGTVQGTATT
ncbi:double homeobox protein A isoform X1 [Camelus ferus]|uniref:Double homeobox protein A isoform X1 n=3 Tax=Camelus TaxID=9836 RepID=A0A8B8TN41_CAMFR|nr:double homeobox protein A [Camelus dromedarius]XP_032343505.1 double homeobox protein A isoform X1 [Camelus ferus]